MIKRNRLKKLQILAPFDVTRNINRSNAVYYLDQLISSHEGKHCYFCSKLRLQPLFIYKFLANFEETTRREQIHPTHQ